MLNLCPFLQKIILHEVSPGYNGNMYPNTKVLMEVTIFCPSGTVLLAGSVLALLENVEKLLSSIKVSLVLGTTFLHSMTMKRGGDSVDTVVIAGHVAGSGKMSFCVMKMCQSYCILSLYMST